MRRSKLWGRNPGLHRHGLEVKQIIGRAAAKGQGSLGLPTMWVHYGEVEFLSSYWDSAISVLLHQAWAQGKMELNRLHF